VHAVVLQVPSLLSTVRSPSAPASHSATVLNDESLHAWAATQHSLSAHAAPAQVPSLLNSVSVSSPPATHPVAEGFPRQKVRQKKSLLKVESEQAWGAAQHSDAVHSAPLHDPTASNNGRAASPAPHSASFENTESAHACVPSAALQQSSWVQARPAQVPSVSKTDSAALSPAAHLASDSNREAAQAWGGRQHSCSVHTAVLHVPALLKSVSAASPPAAHCASVEKADAEQSWASVV
jgi:hypothetical protein